VTLAAGRAGRVVYRLRVPGSLRSSRVALTVSAAAGGLAATRTRTRTVPLARR
jgi:hypothetical protein